AVKEDRGEAETERNADEEAPAIALQRLHAEERDREAGEDREEHGHRRAPERDLGDDPAEPAARAPIDAARRAHRQQAQHEEDEHVQERDEEERDERHRQAGGAQPAQRERDAGPDERQRERDERRVERAVLGREVEKASVAAWGNDVVEDAPRA